MFSKQEVPDENGKKYANKIGEFFQVTSASSGLCINELFFNIWKALLDQNNVNIRNQSSSSNSTNIQLDEKQLKRGKKEKIFLIILQIYCCKHRPNSMVREFFLQYFLRRD